MRASLVPFLLIGALLGACDQLGSYRGTFDGSIVEGNFVRSCFPAKTKATLKFNPDDAVGGDSGVPKSERNWITTDDGTFDHTELVAVANLADDQLSLFDFPGPRRLRNYLLFARPDKGPLADRDATVVISLLENGRVEVRIIARLPDPTQTCKSEALQDAGAAGAIVGDSTPAAHEYFGLFRLKNVK